MKPLFLLIFLTIVFSYVLLHTYLAGWLIKNFKLTLQSGRFLRLALLSMAFLSPLTMVLRKHCATSPCHYVCLLGSMWMGIIIIIIFMIITHDIIIFTAKKFIANYLKKPTPIASGISAKACLIITAIIIGFSVYCALSVPNIKKITVNMPEVPQNIAGIKIIQIADTHMDFPHTINQFEAMVKKINTAKPDLVLMTGDFIDPPMSCDKRIIKAVKNIKSRFGIFAVLGNHEYYSGYEESVECHKKLGVRLLENEIFEFDDFQIIGLNDIRTTQMTKTFVKKIIAKRDKNKFSIIITHQPLFFDMMAENFDFFALAGHTHRGQIFPGHIFAKIFYKYFYGLYKINNSYLYVTSGAGSWGPKMRFLAPTEIPLITLSPVK